MRMSQETYKRLLSNSINVKQNKYHNIKIVIDEIKFDSKKEGYRWLYLKQLEKIGKIKSLSRQVKYELQPSFKYNGKTIRAITYIADFTYIENNELVVEDTKGIKTNEYKLKKKMMLYKYNIEIKET